ncbi:MAG: helix-turn-helix transcriptional regulator [Lachnospiraceae bacterium]|nr:helix-turn-helix transcriptional regulator [Lachnospiraceae bacterium]
MKPFDYVKFCSERVAQIRMERGLTARDLSLGLLQSESYINKIENRKALPSMKSFFSMCEYFNITPQDFFSADLEYPALIREIDEELFEMDEETLKLVLMLVKRLGKAKTESALPESAAENKAVPQQV